MCSGLCRLYFNSFGIIEPILVILKNRIPLKPTLGAWVGAGGVCSLANYSVVYEETQSNRVYDFHDFVCSLFPKAILFDFEIAIWRVVWFVSSKCFGYMYFTVIFTDEADNTYADRTNICVIKTGLSPLIFLLIVPRRFFCCSSSLFVTFSGYLELYMSQSRTHNT